MAINTADQQDIDNLTDSQKLLLSKFSQELRNVEQRLTERIESRPKGFLKLLRDTAKYFAGGADNLLK